MLSSEPFTTITTLVSPVIPALFTHGEARVSCPAQRLSYGDLNPSSRTFPVPWLPVGGVFRAPAEGPAVVLHPSPSLRHHTGNGRELPRGRAGWGHPSVDLTAFTTTLPSGSHTGPGRMMEKTRSHLLQDGQGSLRAPSVRPAAGTDMASPDGALRHAWVGPEPEGPALLVSQPSGGWLHAQGLGSESGSPRLTHVPKPQAPGPQLCLPTR